MKKKIGLTVTACGLLVVACSAGDQTASSQQAFGESTCETQTITAPNGAIVSSYATICNPHSAASSDASYGYSNCQSTFLWEFDNIATGQTQATVTVTPSNRPTTATQCGQTFVDARVIGYSSTGNSGSVVGDYEMFGGPVQGSWNALFGCTFAATASFPRRILTGRGIQ